MQSPEGRTLAATLKTLIDVAYGIAWCFGVIIVLGAAFFGVAAIGGGSFDFGIGGVSADYDSWQAVVPAFLSGFLYSAAAIVILGRLKGVFETLAAGDPFLPINAHRLIVIGWAISVLEIGRYGVQFLSALLIVTQGQPQGGSVAFTFQPSFATWIAVLVVFMLAQVFREGTRLREDRELTI